MIFVPSSPSSIFHSFVPFEFSDIIGSGKTFHWDIFQSIFFAKKKKNLYFSSNEKELN